MLTNMVISEKERKNIFIYPILEIGAVKNMKRATVGRRMEAQRRLFAGDREHEV